MHEKYLNLFCCPETGEALTLMPDEVRPNGIIATGKLVSQSGRVYPIVRGIPRFVKSEHYAASFGYEWNRWPRVQFEDENVGRPMQGHTTRMWEVITASEQRDIRGKSIVEFGCGPGRFLDVVRRKGGVAVGIDISQAVESARKNFPDDPDVLIVQGDIYAPPFRPESFYGGYTIGVLHHTPTPEKGLIALAKTVMKNKWVACSVYHQKGFYSYPSVARFRKLHNTLMPYFGYRIALAYTYISAYILAPMFRRLRRTHLSSLVKYLESEWLPCLSNLPDIRWRLLDTFDGITPSIASTHTRAEVLSWMEKAECKDFIFPAWGDTAIVGIRK
jgi:SAM-dependent methyltransferase